MDFNYDADVLSMTIIERIEEACKQTRMRREEIRVLTEENRLETRPVIIEENKKRIERLQNEIEEFDQMTIEAAKRYNHQLEDIIMRNINLHTGRENIRNKALEYRNKLYEVAKKYNDIFHDVSLRTQNDIDTTVKEEETKVEKNIQDFIKECNRLEKHLDMIMNSLTLNEVLDENVIDEIKGLDSELDELNNKASNLKNEIDAFRASFGSADFSMTVPEIMKTIKDFRTKVKDIKKTQAEKYNERVMAINKKIIELKEMTDLDSELLAAINELDVINLCNDDKIQWNSKAYLDEIDYDKLIQISKKITEIEARLAKKDEKQPVELVPVVEPDDSKDKPDNGEKTSTDDKDLTDGEKQPSKDTPVVNPMDIFALLNKQIDGLEKAINVLDEQVDGLEKPIRDEETRKLIENEIAKLEQEINDIETELEKHKDEDKEKYEATKKRLDEQKEKLANISQKYRSKRPLKVKAVESAKDFYKKHPKLVLIALGLAALALIYAVIGPILIPALIHGNLVLGHCAPALRGVLGGLNNVLGGLIKAKVVNNVWTLASGATIAPYCVSASILKGIAIIGGSSVALTAPLIIAVKELIKKMKKTELIEKIKNTPIATEVPNETEALVAYDKSDKLVKTNDEKREKRRKDLKEMKELLEEYKKVKSRMSIEEFGEQNDLSLSEMEILKFYEDKDNKKAGGR